MAETQNLVQLNQQGFNKFANLLGIRFDSVAEGKCCASIEIREDHFHPGGVVHGGVAYSLADSSMAMALMSTLESGQAASTIELKMSYLAPVRSGTMRCEGGVVRRGKRIAFMEAQVHVDDTLVATANASFAIIDIGTS